MDELGIRCRIVVGGKEPNRNLPAQRGILGNPDAAHHPDIASEVLGEQKEGDMDPSESNTPPPPQAPNSPPGPHK